MMAAGAAGLALAGLVAACAPEAGPVGAARDYAASCAECHGPGGRGNGRLAVGMVPAPPDLTRLAAERDGVFPTARVMARLRAYATGHDAATAPVATMPVATMPVGLPRADAAGSGGATARAQASAPAPAPAPAPLQGQSITQSSGGPVVPRASAGVALAGSATGSAAAPMPVLPALREGPVVMYDDGATGRLATPARLVALTDYLRTIQTTVRE